MSRAYTSRQNHGNSANLLILLGNVVSNRKVPAVVLEQFPTKLTRVTRIMVACYIARLTSFYTHLIGDRSRCQGTL